MTKEEKVKYILKHFKMSEDGKIPISLERWPFYKNINGTLTCSIYALNQSISASIVSYILHYKKWPNFNIRRKKKNKDYSIKNIYLPDECTICGCGTENEPLLPDRKAHQSCRSKQSQKRHETRRNGSIKGRILYLLKSKNKELTFQQKETLSNIVKCTQTKLELKLGHWMYEPSVDRINSNIWYNYKNIQVVCVAYNILKNSASDSDACEWIKAAYESMYGVKQCLCCNAPIPAAHKPLKGEQLCQK